MLDLLWRHAMIHPDWDFWIFMRLGRKAKYIAKLWTYPRKLNMLVLDCNLEQMSVVEISFTRSGPWGPMDIARWRKSCLWKRPGEHRAGKSTPNLIWELGNCDFLMKQLRKSHKCSNKSHTGAANCCSSSWRILWSSIKNYLPREPISGSKMYLKYCIARYSKASSNIV